MSTLIKLCMFSQSHGRVYLCLCLFRYQQFRFRNSLTHLHHRIRHSNGCVNWVDTTIDRRVIITVLRPLCVIREKDEFRRWLHASLSGLDRPSWLLRKAIVSGQISVPAVWLSRSSEQRLDSKPSCYWQVAYYNWTEAWLHFHTGLSMIVPASHTDKGMQLRSCRSCEIYGKT